MTANNPEKEVEIVTIICALHDPKRRETWMGADSWTIAGTLIYPIKATKWFRCGKWMAGVAGMASVALEMQRKASRFGNLGPQEFANKMHTIYEPLAKMEDEKSDLRVSAIIARPEGAWSIDGFCAMPAGDKFIASGSGDLVAYGAAYAASKTGRMAPKDIVRTAVMAAIEYTTDCGGNIYVQVTR